MGVMPDVQYEQKPAILNVGDVIVLYTDGVTEVFDDTDVEFGIDRLVEVIKLNQKRPSIEILDKIVQSVRSFASPSHIFDDLTAIVLKRTV
jgi:sigma-B regulation protein RsbU (phosphoserine phosphatase)